MNTSVDADIQVVNQLFGYYSGLGFSAISFDWFQIAYTGSPLICPWWTDANVLGGFVFVYWLLTPILYASTLLLVPRTKWMFDSLIHL